MAKTIYKEKQAPKETYYLLIVDSSSSMSHLTQSTINGVNEQIDTIKKLQKEYKDQKYFMTFIHFNNEITVEYSNRPADRIERISEANYKCNGMTALLDALGTGIKNTDSFVKEKVNTGEASVVCVVITDGEENSSTEYNGARIKSMIKELEGTERWTFTFVGANIDVIGTATNLGFSTSNTIMFSSDVNSNDKLYKTMSKSFSTRGANISANTYSSADMNLSDADRDLTSK